VAFSTKKSSKGKAPGKAGTRFWKNVGLGFKTPREAIEGEVPANGSIICLQCGGVYLSEFARDLVSNEGFQFPYDPPSPSD
jgi:hypothetical protein